MYAIARVIGSGMDDDGYRLDVKGSGWTGSIRPCNPDGSPKFLWALVKLTDPDNATGIGLFKLPKVNLSLTVGDIPQAKRQAIKDKLDTLGVPTAWITLSTTLREIVRKLGKHLDVNFKNCGGEV
jgi:hypothetical protein